MRRGRACSRARRTEWCRPGRQMRTNPRMRLDDFPLATAGAAVRVKILHVVGARPNFPKLAPVFRAAKPSGLDAGRDAHRPALRRRDVRRVLPRSGHPAADVNLGVGSGTHAAQTARIMERIEPVLVAASSRLGGGLRRRELDGGGGAGGGEDRPAGGARRGGRAEPRLVHAGRDQPGRR